MYRKMRFALQSQNNKTRKPQKQTNMTTTDQANRIPSNMKLQTEIKDYGAGLPYRVETNPAGVVRVVFTRTRFILVNESFAARKKIPSRLDLLEALGLQDHADKRLFWDADTKHLFTLNEVRL